MAAGLAWRAICCESSARDAMMLNFKVTMVADAQLSA
jgi:nicotinamidase-related amidase